MSKYLNKFLAIIPARAGSKGVKNKNRTIFGNKPLIFWTINEALKSKFINKIIISSDDKKILSFKNNFNSKKVIFLERKKILATDTSLIFDTLSEILDTYRKNYKSFILLQPDSPLRKKIDIDKSINTYLNKKALSCVSVTKTKKPPDLYYKINKNKFLINKFINNSPPRNKQDYEYFYEINGAIYISNIMQYYKSQSFISKKTCTYEMPIERSVDIDSYYDLRLAKFLLKSR